MAGQDGDVQAMFSALDTAEAAAGASLQSLGASSAEAAGALHKDLQAQLARLRALLRDLELAVDEEDSETLQQQLSAQLVRHKAKYENLQAGARAHQLQAMKRVPMTAAAERQALLGGRSPADASKKIRRDEDAAAVTQDTTASLQRTRQMLLQELDHTSTALAAMESSHTTLAAARTQYATQASAFRRSRQLLSTIRLHAVLDWLLLWGGVIFFALVVLFILQKRLLYFVPGFLKPSFLSASLRASPHPSPAPPPQFAPVDWAAVTAAPKPPSPPQPPLDLAAQPGTAPAPASPQQEPVPAPSPPLQDLAAASASPGAAVRTAQPPEQAPAAQHQAPPEAATGAQREPPALQPAAPESNANAGSATSAAASPDDGQSPAADEEPGPLQAPAAAMDAGSLSAALEPAEAAEPDAADAAAPAGVPEAQAVVGVRATAQNGSEASQAAAPDQLQADAGNASVVAAEAPELVPRVGSAEDVGHQLASPPEQSAAEAAGVSAPAGNASEARSLQQTLQGAAEVHNRTEPEGSGSRDAVPAAVPSSDAGAEGDSSANATSQLLQEEQQRAGQQDSLQEPEAPLQADVEQDLPTSASPANVSGVSEPFGGPDQLQSSLRSQDEAAAPGPAEVPSQAEQTEESSHERSFGQWYDDGELAAGTFLPGTEAEQPIEGFEVLTSTLEELPFPQLDAELTPQQQHERWARDSAAHAALEPREGAPVVSLQGESILAMPADEQNSSFLADLQQERPVVVHDEL